jgi:hypothetical protein
MQVKQLIKQLRHAASALEVLYEVSGTPAIAAQIGRRVGPSLKSRSYRGRHWTQQPKNRARMLKMLRHANRQRVVVPVKTPVARS